MDGVFSSNESYHDSQLAYDLRGTLGVRACPAIEGDGELHIMVFDTFDEGEDDDTVLLLSEAWENGWEGGRFKHPAACLPPLGPLPLPGALFAGFGWGKCVFARLWRKQTTAKTIPTRFAATPLRGRAS